MINVKNNQTNDKRKITIVPMNFNYFTTIAKQVLTTYKYLPLAPMLAQGDH